MPSLRQGQVEHLHSWHESQVPHWLWCQLQSMGYDQLCDELSTGSAWCLVLFQLVLCGEGMSNSHSLVESRSRRHFVLVRCAMQWWQLSHVARCGQEVLWRYRFIMFYHTGILDVVDSPLIFGWSLPALRRNEWNSIVWNSHRPSRDAPSHVYAAATMNTIFTFRIILSFR